MCDKHRKDRNMKVELAPIDTIKPYPNNPRKLSETAIEKVAQSIQEFGFRQPIVIDKDRIIVVGHTRYRASKKLGYKKVPITIAENLTKEQINAYRIADNRTNEEAKWDEELLKMELKELDYKDFDLKMTGFDDKQINDLLFEEKQGLTDDDDVPDTPEKPITKLGDIWQLGKHRLLCGDSTNSNQIELLMNGQKADMVFTDPPYALFGNSTGVAGVVDDNMVKPFFRNIMLSFKKYTKIYSHIYMCCDWHSAFSIENCAREVELKPKNMCIWDKGDGGVGAMYQQCYEIIWFFDNSPTNKTTFRTVKAGVRTVNGKPNIWRFKRVTGNRIHNAQKPIEMISMPIICGSDKNNIILDLFLGSGSTLIACEKLDRICYGIELDPKYCDVIVKRWEQWTGEKATK